MENENKASLYTVMYCEEDEVEPTPTNRIATPRPSGASKTRKIRVGIVEYEVPTIEYVTRLEATVLYLLQRVEQQAGDLCRLQQSLNRLQSHIRRQSHPQHRQSLET